MIGLPSSLFCRRALLIWLMPLAAAWAEIPPATGGGQSPDPAPVSGTVPQKELPDYVRLSEGPDTLRLETAITTFTLPDGRTVDLFGVIHLGDASYYKEADRRLGAYDAVLFELVGDPSALTKPDVPRPPARPHPLRTLQQGMGRVFKLQFQLENIDYSRPTFVHADATAEEFSAMQRERGESMSKMLLKSFELAGDPSMKDAENLGLVDLIMLFHSEKAMLRVKTIFARLLANSEEVLEKKLLGGNSAIIHGRNDVALAKLEEVLSDVSKKRIAVFYGAGHMPSMEEDMVTRLKAVRGAEVWLPAWTMPAPPAPAKKTKRKADRPSPSDSRPKSGEGADPDKEKSPPGNPGEEK